jgi:hypothetical protein
MNARERRQFDRRFKTKIVFRYRQHESVDSDVLDKEVMTWCNKNVGRSNWARDSGCWLYRGYFFADPKYASLFMLRWS